MKCTGARAKDLIAPEAGGSVVSMTTTFETFAKEVFAPAIDRRSSSGARFGCAVAGNALSPEERKKCCQVAKPGTILDWFRQLAARKYDSSKRKVGRPQKGTQPRPGPVGYPLLRDHVKRHHVTRAWPSG